MTKLYQLVGADGRLYSSATKGLFGGNRRAKTNFRRFELSTARAYLSDGAQPIP